MARRRGHFWPVAILAFLNLSAYAYNQWVYVNLGHTIPLDNILPFHLCDIAAFLAGFALLTPRPLVRELCYCWGSLAPCRLFSRRIFPTFSLIRSSSASSSTTGSSSSRPLFLLWQRAGGHALGPFLVF
ncbi:YwaF family protein [Akkermansiaceae bacterium]|nr:YwaF family protein [Akkermansiaceae bacterium]